MLRLSSNLTLLLKIFIPFFWMTIIAGFTLVAWFGPEKYFEGINLNSLRWGLVSVLLFGLVFFYLLCWPLKRVETDDVHIYVSNYFKTARYRWDTDVEALNETRFMLFFPIAFLVLKGKGTFGRKPFFLVKRKHLKQFKEAFPELIPK